MTQSTEWVETPREQPATPPDGRIIGGARFLTTFVLANAGMYAVFQGMQQIVLPSQIALIDPDGKVGSYGALASIGALAAAVSNPLFGMLSDRTRSRFGRRTPWLILTAFAALGFLAVLGGMTSLFWLGAAYLLVMVSMGAYQAVITAVMPDRVPESRRGFASALLGLAAPIGVIYGLNVAPAFVNTPVLAYLVIGALLIVGVLVMVVLAPDPTANRTLEATPTGSAKGGFFSSLRDHDFAWAFWSRATIMIGFWTISTYQLYALTDYIGVENLPGGNAAAAVALLGTINLGGTIITSLIAGPLSDKLQRRKIFVVIASIGVGVGAIIPVVSPSWTGMIIYAVVSGLFFGAYSSVDQAIMTLVVPDPENTARDLGLLNIATTGPQIAGPFLAAVIITATGGYAPLFIFAAIAAVASAFLILPIRKVA